MIVLIALVAVVSLMPASAETLEVRGTIADFGPVNPTIAVSACTPLYVADYDNDAANGLQPGFQWDYSSFAGRTGYNQDFNGTIVHSLVSGMIRMMICRPSI
jgi:phosphate-selective porin